MVQCPQSIWANHTGIIIASASNVVGDENYTHAAAVHGEEFNYLSDVLNFRNVMTFIDDARNKRSFCAILKTVKYI